MGRGGAGPRHLPGPDGRLPASHPALELVLKAGVYRRPRRWLAALVPVFLVFSPDWVAIRRGHWTYSPRYTTGIELLGLPLEELVFFVVVPTCAPLTYQAVVRLPPSRDRRGRRGDPRVHPALGLRGRLPILLEVLVLRTGLFRDLRVALAIVAAFQLLVNGVLPARRSSATTPTRSSAPGSSAPPSRTSASASPWSPPPSPSGAEAGVRTPGGGGPW